MAYIRLGSKVKTVKCSCVPNRFYFSLRSRSAGTSAQTCEECSKWSFFSRLGPFFLTFWAGQGVAYVGSAQNIKSVTCSCVPSCFSFVLWARLTKRSVQCHEKWSFFNAFSHLGPLSLVFAQVKEWVMLKLQKLIRVS